ncbi:MAG: DUF1254 domain-containing protein [bacterium]|nr:DUF1254 domain-containing protein [bacterium]
MYLGGCSSQDQIRSTDAVPVAEIEDGLSVEEFRRYGQSSPLRVHTRIGELEFTEGGFAGGYPTLDTVEKLYDEMDFQRATQAYLWAVPLVSYAEWLRAHEQVFKASDGQLVQQKTPLAKRGILTANSTTPYVVGFADLTRTGPLIFDVPAGPSAGIINDMWQRAIWDFGVSGPDAGKGARILILAPGMDEPAGLDEEEFVVVRNPTNVVFFGIRALQPDPVEADTMLHEFATYPYADRSNPRSAEMMVIGDDVAWGQWQPHGMAYWESLKVIIDREVFDERDRFMLAMLDSLGIRKGVPFQPDARQRRILKEAAIVGEAMAKANTFGKRFENANIYEGTHWDQLMVVNHDDRAEHYDQLYRRAAFAWEAVTRGKAYYIEKPGIGQQYRTGYMDSDGHFLSGSKHYSLTMPPNPPAKTFWSIVVYDVNTRTLIINEEGRPAASSRTGVEAGADGSVTLHFSPVLPAGVAKGNWIQTNAGEGWFAYLRFYGPTEAYFDQSYPLQDIMLVK